VKSWGKYVPWPVVQLLLNSGIDHSDNVEERQVTVFFSDIAGFTTIVEKLTPERSMMLLSRYFNDMSRAIDEYDGVILEFVGDAIMAIYGAPLLNSEHPANGIKATLRMFTQLRKLNEWAVTKDLPQVGIRCGVHTGTMLVGNMGFRTRVKYGVVGEESSIPGKLEESNKSYGTNMLISSHTYSLIKTADFVIRPIDYLCLRSSVDTSELVYEVADRIKKRVDHPLTAVYALHAEAMQHYIKREFGSAAERFTEVGVEIKYVTDTEDMASQVMFERCQSYIKQPPDEGWTGVWDRGE